MSIGHHGSILRKRQIIIPCAHGVLPKEKRRKAENAANLGLRSRSLLIYSTMTAEALPLFRLFDFVNRLENPPISLSHFWLSTTFWLN